MMSVGTPRPYLKQPGGQYAPAVSHDGRWMTYTSDESGRPEIYVAPFSPQGSPRIGRLQVSTEGGVYPLWSHDGRQIFFRSMTRFVMVAAFEGRGDTFRTASPRAWSTRRLDAAAGFPSFDLAPNGRVAGIFEAGQVAPETHLRVLLNLRPAQPQ
jgi:serine/threonine-protein kinase